MPNGTYGGVRGKETKVGQKTFVSQPTRLLPVSSTGSLLGADSAAPAARASPSERSEELLFQITTLLHFVLETAGYPRWPHVLQNRLELLLLHSKTNVYI